MIRLAAASLCFETEITDYVSDLQAALQEEITEMANISDATARSLWLHKALHDTTFYRIPHELIHAGMTFLEAGFLSDLIFSMGVQNKTFDEWFLYTTKWAECRLNMNRDNQHYTLQKLEKMGVIQYRRQRMTGYREVKISAQFLSEAIETGSANLRQMRTQSSTANYFPSADGKNAIPPGGQFPYSPGGSFPTDPGGQFPERVQGNCPPNIEKIEKEEREPARKKLANARSSRTVTKESVADAPSSLALSGKNGQASKVHRSTEKLRARENKEALLIPEQSKTDSWSSRCARRLHEVVTDYHQIRREFSAKKWSADLERLAREWDKDLIIEVLEWYCENPDTLRVQGASSFCKVFEILEGKYAKTKGQSSSGSKTEAPIVDKATPDIVEEIEHLGWPKGSANQLPAAVDQTLQKMRQFYDRLQGIIDKTEKPKFKGQQMVTNWMPDFAANVLASFGVDPESATTRWFKDVHARIKNWKEWSGDLKAFTFSQFTNKEWRKKIRECSFAYSANNSFSDLLLSLFTAES